MTTDTAGPGMRNGIDLIDLASFVTMARRSDGPMPLRVQVTHRWVDGNAFEVRGGTLVALGETLDRSHHGLRTDIPPLLGGTDGGLAPTEVLLAALGSCVGIMFVTAAAAKGITLQSARVTLTTDLDLRGTVGVAGTSPAPSGVSITIDAESDADAAALERLGREALRLSPVAGSLSRPVPIEVSVHRVDPAVTP